MIRRRYSTYAFLTKYLFRHFLSRLWWTRRRSEGELSKFLHNYRDDHTLPLTPEEREVFPSFEVCVSCGLCTATCLLTAAPGNLSGSTRIDPRTLAIAYSRSIPDFWTARELVEKCRDCGLCEEICPTDAPLKRMMRFMTEKLREEAA
jgi:succinate dehydrogenase/fumarate reductase-like Fe-S protein